MNRKIEARPYTISANLPGRSGRLVLDDEPGKSGQSIEGRPGFRPRQADLGESRFWRIDPMADYGALTGLARHRVRTEPIVRHWDDLLRL
jgi:hypothetical protein